MSMNKPPVTVFSIDFKEGIPLRDPATDQPINAHPHWVRGTRNEPAAYVRRSSVALDVVFLDICQDNLDVVLKTVYARESGGDGGGGVRQAELTIGFDPDSGLSEPVRLELAAHLPDAIGVHECSFEWYVTSEAGDTFFIGSTTHTFYTIWKSMLKQLERPVEQSDYWAYEPLMRWSCQWAAGQQDDKAICDALIKQLPSSGLIYGLAGDPQTVRSLLLRGGGTCGAWYQFFQQLAYCQGVQVSRLDMTIVTEKRGDDWLWNGAVATAGGLNQPYPDVAPYRFDEDNQRFPIGPDPVAVETVEARRYVFAGESLDMVGTGPSTHAVNFLDHDGHVYLYDPSFGAGPYSLDVPVPKPGVMDVESLAKFKTAYLDERFPYLMGSIHNGGVFYETVWGPRPKCGLLVSIKLISPDDIKISWSANT